MMCLLKLRTAALKPWERLSVFALARGMGCMKSAINGFVILGGSIKNLVSKV